MSAETTQQQRKRPRKRNKPNRLGREERSLSCLVQALEGRKLVVELRNDVIIRGILDEADEYMNLSMSQVSTQDVQGKRMQMNFLYVRGRNIRFVHLPKSLDPAAAVEHQRQKLIQLRVDAFKTRQQQMQAASSIAKGDGGAAYEIQDMAIYRPPPQQEEEEHIQRQQQQQQQGLHTQSFKQPQQGVLKTQGAQIQPSKESTDLRGRQLQDSHDQANKQESALLASSRQQPLMGAPVHTTYNQTLLPAINPGDQSYLGQEETVSVSVQHATLSTSQQAHVVQQSTTTTTTFTAISAANIAEDIEDAIGDDELLAGLDIYDTGIDIEDYSDEEETIEPDEEATEAGIQPSHGNRQPSSSPAADDVLQPSASVIPTDAEQDFGDFDFE